MAKVKRKMVTNNAQKLLQNERAESSYNDYNHGVFLDNAEETEMKKQKNDVSNSAHLHATGDSG